MLLSHLLEIINGNNFLDSNYTIARFLVENYTQIEKITIQALADGCFLSVPTIKKFLNSLGISTFHELKGQIQGDLLVRKQQIHDSYSTKTEEQIWSHLVNINSNVNSHIIDQINEIIIKIISSKNIRVFGSSSLTPILHNFQIDMVSMGKVVRISTIIDQNYQKIQDDELILLISGKGRFLNHPFKVIEDLDNRKNNIYVICGDYQGTSLVNFNNLINLKSPNELFDSNYLFLIIFDLIRYKYFKEVYSK